jgi:pyruvate/2-oxoglutarate dehydrogenase complex dihydrolipoamide dehydrogenase (E3) component
VVEALPQILAAEDDEIAKVARAIRETGDCDPDQRKGREHEARCRQLVGTVESGGATEDVVADAIIVATGVRANIENLGVEE